MEEGQGEAGCERSTSLSNLFMHSGGNAGSNRLVLAYILEFWEEKKHFYLSEEMEFSSAFVFCLFVWFFSD